MYKIKSLIVSVLLGVILATSCHIMGGMALTSLANNIKQGVVK